MSSDHSTDETLNRVGAMFAEVQIGLIDSLRPTFLERGILTEDGFEKLRRQVVNEVQDDSLQLQKHFVFAWAQKRVEKSR